MYLHKIVSFLSGKPIDIAEYKLARKEVYVSSANLSSAFQRMLSEPKSKQKNVQAVHQFVVLNNTLFSNIAAIGSTVIAQPQRTYPDDVVYAARKAGNSLCGLVKSFDKSCAVPVLENASVNSKSESAISTDDVLLKEQLEFIYRLSGDINKVMKKITAG